MVSAGTDALRSISCPGVLVAPMRDWTETTTPMVIGSGRGCTLPVQVIMVSQFQLITDLNIYGTYWGVILPTAASAFGVFLARQFILGIPREVIEAALAHQLKDKAEAAYARGDLFTKRRKLMEEWAAFLARPAAPVVELQAAISSRAEVQ